jgi:hypothetical protein
MDLPEWLDFFLLHEAHHLYTAMICIGEARLDQDSSSRSDFSNRRGN